MGRRDPSWDELRTFFEVVRDGSLSEAARTLGVTQPTAADTSTRIGGCQEGIARRSKDLVPVLPEAFQIALEVWLVMHRDLKSTSRVRLLFDWLAKGLSDYVRGKFGPAAD